MTKSTWKTSDETRTEKRAAKNAQINAELQANKASIINGEKSALDFMLFEDDLIATERTRIQEFNENKKWFQRREPSNPSAATFASITDRVSQHNIYYTRFLTPTEAVTYNERNQRSVAHMNKLITKYGHTL